MKQILGSIIFRNMGLLLQQCNMRVAG